MRRGGIGGGAGQFGRSLPGTLLRLGAGLGGRFSRRLTACSPVAQVSGGQGWMWGLCGGPLPGLLVGGADAWSMFSVHEVTPSPSLPDLPPSSPSCLPAFLPSVFLPSFFSSFLPSCPPTFLPSHLLIFPSSYHPPRLPPSYLPTWLIRKRPPLGPYRGPRSRVPGWSHGGGRFLTGEFLPLSLGTPLIFFITLKPGVE
jgi:hypothetical protein